MKDRDTLIQHSNILLEKSAVSVQPPTIECLLTGPIGVYISNACLSLPGTNKQDHSDQNTARPIVHCLLIK